MALDTREWLAYDSAACSIARTADVLADRWTLRILRDVLRGVRRFDALHDHLGVSREVLSRRLAALVEAGVLERRAYREEGSRERLEYRVTAAGAELNTVLAALMDWGDRHLAGPAGAPAELHHRDCGGRVHGELRCEHGHRLEGGREIEVALGPGAVRLPDA